jgi:hypothetical protein
VPHTRVGYSLKLRDEGALDRVLGRVTQEALQRREVDVEC